MHQPTRTLMKWFTLAGLAITAAGIALPLISSSTPAVHAADAPAAKENEQAGLALTFTVGQASDVRASRQIALHVPQGTSPTPFLPAGPFVATWEGNFNMKIRDTYTFSAQGGGKLTVTVNEKAVLEGAGDDLAKLTAEPVRLNKGKNKVTIRYESPTQGDARFRLLWTPKGELMAEPPPPMALTHDASAEATAKARQLRDGRFLLAQMRCVACHATGIDKVPPVVPTEPAEAVKPGPMPELAMDAPSLKDVGDRLRRDWMTIWINNPHALRAEAHMPRVFHDNDGKMIDQRAADIAAFLVQGVKGAEPARGPEEEQVTAGGVLYTTLNCVACHNPPDSDPNAAPAAGESTDDADLTLAAQRISHRSIAAKFTRPGLKQYLLNPHAHYKWNPMPNFKLSDEEAEALTTYLLAKSESKFPFDGKIPDGDPAKGKQLVESSGCLNCHAMGETKSSLKAPPLADLKKEGWAKGAAKGADFHTTGPKYDLSDDQRGALIAFGGTDRSSLTREALPEFAERQVVAMRCIACHSRDGKESLLATTLDQEQKDLEGKFPPPQPADAEAFAPDQRPPLLTWAGEKLKPQWAAHFIAGQIPYKPRPYLRARMPAFDARAGGIAAGLSMEHGYAPTNPPAEKRDAEMAKAGQTLAGKAANQSFSCTQCHAVAKNPPSAPFEAPAVNFAYTADRLQKDYYHRWIHNPVRIDPNTKMPAFEREDGKTTITAFYDGDARKQFEALWHYLQAGKEIQPPAE